MFIHDTLCVIYAFFDRYVKYTNEREDYTEITTIDNKVRFTYNNEYYLYSWIENGELKIENEHGESVFDYAEEHGWTSEDVEYIKFGRR